VRIDDEYDLRQRLDQALQTVTPHPAPIDDAVRRGRTIRVRRRVVAAATVAAVAAVGAVAAFGPSSLHKLVSPPPATRVNRPTVTVQPPGPHSVVGLIAWGTVDGKSWQIAATDSATDGLGAGQELFVAFGAAFGPSAVSTAGPALGTYSTGPVTFGGSAGGSVEAQYGAVQADVSYVTVRLGDDTVLTLHPVTVYGARAVAFAAPVGTGIASVTAYSRHGEIATAIPFNDPGDMAFFGAWLKPGQHGLARASGVIFSGRPGGSGVQVAAYQGPWGVCIKVTGDGTGSVGCTPALSAALGGNVVCWTSGKLSYVLGETSAPVTRLVLAVPGERSIQVRPVRVGGQKLFAVVFVAPSTADNLGWKAYDSSGAVVSSGRVAVPPPSS
jgi:hypothetical protein